MSKELIPVNEILADMPHYDWQKYGYSLITEETFEGGFHDGDYEKDGVIHCGYCHTPNRYCTCGGANCGPSPSTAGAKPHA